MSNALHGTLVANTATPVTVRGWEFGVWVINRGSDDIWARLDGTAATVAGTDNYLVGAGGARNFPTGDAAVTVSLISAGTPGYSVEGAVVVA